MTLAVTGSLGQGAIDIALGWCAWFAWRVVLVTYRTWRHRHDRRRELADAAAKWRQHEQDEYERRVMGVGRRRRRRSK